MAVMSEEMLGVIAPVAVYWLYSGLCAVMGSMDKHRLFTNEETEEKNLATKAQVVKGVLLNQAIQVAVFGLLSKFGGQGDTAGQSSLWVTARQLAVATLVYDAWHYWAHRIQHTNSFLYRRVHSQHHALVVPYPYGSQYNHPVEDAINHVGGVITHLVSGMSPRTAMLFFCVATLKGIDDHCGLWFPRHPFHRWFDNNSAFHASHHQLYGLKFNFSSPFLAVWDRLMGTYLPYAVERREVGVGWEMRPAETLSKND